MMKRLLRLVIFVGLLAPLGGCQETLSDFVASVEPQLGHVPYEARVVCSPLIGEYSYRLPDGSVVTTSASELAVVVDRLDWVAEVTWSDGKQLRTDTARAQGNNAAPTILRPTINGDASRWYLRPRERTLIDFSYRERSMYGPETGVTHDGPFRIVEIRVEAKLKKGYGIAVGDSIFCPPYEAGVFHAYFGGSIRENACIVYPLYTGETAPNGRPYAPAAEEGYTYEGYRIRNVFYGVTFPPQTVTITVVVEDEWGRWTSGSFEIPVEASNYGVALDDEGKPIHQGSSGTWYEDHVFFVAARNGTFYYPSWCPEVYKIPPSERIYFLSEGNAQAAGKRSCPECCLPPEPL